MLRVLAYHRIDWLDSRADLHPGLISATPPVFEAQMRHVASRYVPVSLAQVLAAAGGAEPLPPRAVLVTFDDGYRDFAQHAWPVLKRYGVPAVLFVPTSYVSDASKPFWWDRLHRAVFGTQMPEIAFGASRGSLRSREDRGRTRDAIAAHVKTLPARAAISAIDDICRELGDSPAQDRSVLNWAELRSLAADGVVVGAHTRTHPILPNVAAGDLRSEIAGSLEDLVEHLGAAPPAFCYPNGSVDERSAEALREAGVKVAFTMRDGHNDLRSCDLLRLRRTGVTTRTGATILRLRLLRAVSYVDMLRHGRMRPETAVRH